MNKYKIKFNDYQNNILTAAELNGDKKRKAMSVLSYLMKYSQDTKVTKSINTLYKMYVRYHANMSCRHFYRIVDSLNDLGLINKEKREIFIILDLQKCQKECQKKCQIENTPSTVEITELESNSNLLNNQPQQDLYTDTLHTQTDVDVVAPIELVYLAKNMIKELGIRSKIVEEAVITKLRNCFNVNRKGVLAYIKAVVMEKRIIQESHRINFRNTIKYKSNVKAAESYNDGFNNFEGRNYTLEEYEDMERRLLAASLI